MYKMSICIKYHLFRKIYNKKAKKLHPNNSLFIPAASTEEPRNNGGQPKIVSEIGILL